MAIRDTWRRALEYFGLVEGDYIEEGEYDEGDTGSEMALDQTAVAPATTTSTTSSATRNPRRAADGSARSTTPRRSALPVAAAAGRLGTAVPSPRCTW